VPAEFPEALFARVIAPVLGLFARNFAMFLHFVDMVVSRFNAFLDTMLSLHTLMIEILGGRRAAPGQAAKA
jgi:hypothetical protein